MPSQPRIAAETRRRLLLGRPASYVVRAAKAAFFPIKGIWYFLRRPYFYPLFVGRLLPLSIISLLVYFVLFTFAFLPQLAFLAIFQGWAAACINATMLVLGEGLVVIQGIFEGFFVDECRVDVFDATLIEKGLIDLVAPQRILFPDAPNPVKKLGKPTAPAEYQPWSLVQIVELIFFLPLNLVPYVGAPAFIMITGARLGKLSHHRWFKLRGLDKKAVKRDISLRSWDYLWFGTVAMILELCPILNFFFLLTTTAGAALWVVKIEERARIHVGRRITTEDLAAQGTLNEPVYRDNPV
ncbi:outer spore wall protein RRT8 [Podospora aff. communis PSN243]|uniref:Outer spore wall protein RRT8 n=1 Tax=Podospora aff. communis PSN243 TaxID=3040156 RepID=A0AAV9GIF6_9PEZI|nr:outer spore wall protein RRT8 [Podospora aff. communis PSN243]